MNNGSFKHSSVRAIAAIYGQVFQLEKVARSNINDEMAIDVRDLCQDIIYKIDMWERSNALKFLPKSEGE